MIFFSKTRNFIVNFNGFISNSKASKCIYYHDIHSDNKYTEMSTPVNIFIKHIETIRKRNFEIVSNINNQKNQIKICFDDGFKGLYENLDKLHLHKIPVQIFIITSLIDTPGYLTKSELVKLSKDEFVDVQSHTCNHHSLHALSESIIKQELEDSKNILEDICGKEISAICYPKGYFNSTIIRIAKEVGYKFQYSSIPGKYFDNLYHVVKRRSLVQFADEKYLINVLRGGDNILSHWYIFKHFKS